MNLLDIYRGNQTWADYLGAAGPANPDLPPEQMAGGIERLNADFHLLLGDLVWKCELASETLNELLGEVRLAEFEREARAYRLRAERAYINGWYDEALADFLAAAERNYPDYAVHRSIAQLYLYHRRDPARAREYFARAAKYARPSDARQAAEAHYFAGAACALERNFEAAMEEFAEAARLNPGLGEAHYQRATIAAMQQAEDTAIAALEAAIEADARYHERAQADEAFAALRLRVDALLLRLMKPVEQKVAEVRRDAATLEGYVIAPPEERKITGLFHEVERRMSTGLTYQGGLHVLAQLDEVERELRGIHERFHKQYSIDPRDYVRAVAFSPDGQRLASGFLNGGLQVWEVDSGLQLYSFIAHPASVNSVAFSPDNLWLASGSRDRKIKLWEAASGREMQTLAGHTGEVRAVAFSPDGLWLASGGHDGCVRLWRAVTGQQAEIFAGHRRQVTSTIFSPDGSLIASGSWDRTVRLWDAASGRTVRTLVGHAKGVSAIAFSPDGRWIASGGEDGEVRLWDLTAGRTVLRFEGHRNSINSLAFSPDGSLLASGCLGQRIILWKASTAEVVRDVRYEDISYNSVAFSPRGQWLALGSRDLQLWLKALLTKEEFEAVRAGEQRAREARARAEELGPYLPVARSEKKRERGSRGNESAESTEQAK
ncbi:MAG: WD40 repeat domain-containing protein [Acidobacteria bacterium]|nr:WD40 repeat domain-containing protein [Acidobacteriota bacterium]MCW5970732.1 WD40 repeat domain-containing protein [Blastocatellales bacterium]